MERSIQGNMIERFFHYPGYLEYMKKVLDDEGTEDEERDPIRNNLRIMERLDERMELKADLQELLGKGDVAPRIWAVITEARCPDSARNLPFIRAVADPSPHIELIILLRDENPELMEHFLTDGKRAVPKLLEMDPKHEQVHNTWGPRPSPLQERVEAWKAEEPEISKEELQRRIQKWYAKDKGNTLQEELKALLGKSIPDSGKKKARHEGSP